MIESFEEYYSKADDELNYLIEFMFQLTIVGRMLQNELEGDALKASTKQLNELNHRVLNRIRDIGNPEPWCKKEYLIEMVPHHVNLAPQISKGVAHAASKAYTKLHA